MPKIDPNKLEIRIMRREDVDAIIEIDAKVLGEERFDYYKRKCAMALDDSLQLVTSMVAVYEDRVIGFIMGNIYLGELGIPETVASIDTLAVDPDYQGQRVALELMRQFTTNAKEAQIENIYTIAPWNAWKMLRLLEKTGFVPSKAIPLEMNLT